MNIDQHGRGLVGAFQGPTAPADHRSNITTQDASDPTSATGFIDAAGYSQVDFFVDTSGATGLTKLGLRILYYNPTDGKVYRGALVQLTNSADLVNPVVSFEARGLRVYGKVESLTLTSGAISIDYSLS